MFDGFCRKSRDTPSIVRPRPFAPGEADVVLDRPQTPEEVARWLEAAGFQMAPATNECRAWVPDAAWMVWMRKVGYQRTHPQLLDLATDHHYFENERRGDIAKFLARRELRLALQQGFQSGCPGFIDRMRAWLLDPDHADPSVAPALLRSESADALRHPHAFGLSFAATMTLRQWGDGAREWRRFRTHSPWFDLLDDALSVVSSEMRSRMDALPQSHAATTPRPRL